MMIFKPGDNVLFQVRENEPPYRKGIILKRNSSGNYAIACVDSGVIVKNVDQTWIVPISYAIKVRNQIIHSYEEKICKLRNQIKEESSKSIAVIDTLVDIAKNLIDEKNIENRLDLVSGMCCIIKENNIDNCISTIRKNNCKIDKEIKDKIFERDVMLQYVSDESIKSDFDF